MTNDKNRQSAIIQLEVLRLEDPTNRDTYDKVINILKKYKNINIGPRIKDELYVLGFIPRARYIKRIEDRPYVFSSFEVKKIDNKLCIGLSQTSQFNSNWLEIELR